VNLAELHHELERLGSGPVPVLDEDRVEALEQRLLRGFAVASPAAQSAPALAGARRRRRQVLVAGTTAAAAALAAAMVIAQDGTATYEVSAATGAVAMYPDGASRPVQAGDHVPAGGLIRTGSAGAVTIEETTVGADHVVLLDEDDITLLPTPPSLQPGPDVQGGDPSAQPAVTAPASAPTAAPVTLVPTIATPAPPAPAAVNPAPLSLTVSETNEGIQVSWTPSDADGVVRYVVVRGTADSNRLDDIAELSADQTAFTDTTPPTGVELCYKVVAVDADGLPLAVSETHTIVFEGSGGANEIPPSTDVPVTAPATRPDRTTTTTSLPPSTAANSTTAPSTTVVETSVETTSAPTVAGSAPDTAPLYGGRDSVDGSGEDGNLDNGG
jgi:hypothetical protein